MIDSENLGDYRRLMRATCLRLGNLLNQTELGRDTGLLQPTVHRYLNLLETSFQLVRLAPYSVNRTKRLIKTPKVYWSDTGRLRGGARGRAAGNRGQDHHAAIARGCRTPARLARGVRKARSRRAPAPCRDGNVLDHRKRARHAMVACAVATVLGEPFQFRARPSGRTSSSP